MTLDAGGVHGAEATQPLNRTFHAELARLQATGLFRQRRVVRAIDPVHIECDGRRLINFSSNNYLGLTHHPDIVRAVCEATMRDGFGSGAAPLVSGYSPTHLAAEQALAELKGAQDARLFPSGYQANVAAVQTLAAVGRLSGKVRFLIDKSAHASLIDAVRAAEAPFRVFPHNGLGKLRRLLEEADAGEVQIVVTESIFSMDGDAADLASIVGLKARRPFVLLLDESHATGVYGRSGAGLADELEMSPSVDVSVVTLSKALGGVGGAVCASSEFCQGIDNFGRAYLFSTGAPSAVAAATGAAVAVMAREPERQHRVRATAKKLRRRLREMKLGVPAGDSPIIPIIAGAQETALRWADELVKAGFLCVAIRPPTVARGTSRLRITVSSSHSDEDVQSLAEALGRTCL